MRDDGSRHDREIFIREIEEAVADTMEGGAGADRTDSDTRGRTMPSDFEVLMGYVQELESQYGIVVPEKILIRLKDLEKFTKPHNRDARVIYEAFFQVFHWRRKTGNRPDTPELSEEDLGIGLAASLLHDIGKSGPANAQGRKRELVSRLYNLEVLPNGPDTPIDAAVRMIFREAAEVGKGEALTEKLQAYLTDLRNLGIKPNDLMPSFWRAHAEWTKQILTKTLDQSNPIYRRITKIAASHHYFEGSNPEGLDFHAAGLTEEERKDNYLTKLLIFLDQYQGARRRGHKNPTEALEFVKNKLSKNGLAADPDFLEILFLVEHLEKTTAIFRLGAEVDAEVKR